MISAGVEGRLPYMTYPDPYRGPPKQPPEFLRPAPKPLPSVRYNGLHSPSSPQNGTRLVAQRPTTKYSPPAIAPVNLTQHKEDLHEEQLTYPVYPRLFHPYNHFPQNPYSTIYQSPYTPIARPSYPHPPPLSPLETYSPTTPTASTFLSPPSNFSPPSAPKVQSIPKDKRSQASFKVPSGKEGSLKHRILTRPEDSRAPLDLQQKEVARSRLHATQSPPESPKKPLNNNTVTGSFAKGSLIRLANGDLRRVEDMRTEDFVTSAQQSPELRLADSTVVRIEENPIMGTATITLSYNQRRAQVEVETTLEHPFFVYGQGWASCNPDRTLHCYGLKVHNLQVGDVLISLTPREHTNPRHRNSTIVTTATTTAVTPRQMSTSSMAQNSLETLSSQQGFNQLNPTQSLSPDSLSRKRRWSAPDQICDEDEQNPRKH